MENNEGENRKQYFLITTALRDFWNQSSENIIILGEWCKVNKSKYKIEKRYRIEPFIWKDKIKQEKAILYCDTIYERVIDELVVILNSYSETDYERPYWEFIIGPWLYSYIQNVYDRYINIRAVKEKYKNLETLLLNKNNYKYSVVMSDCNYNDDFFNLQLYSMIIEGFDIKKHYQEYGGINNSYAELKTEVDTRRDFLYRTSALLNKVFSKKKVIVTDPYIKYHPVAARISILLKSKFAIIFNDFSYQINIKKKIEKQKRRDIFWQYKDQDYFVTLLFQTFTYNLPAIYLELHNEYRKNIDLHKIPVVTHIFSSVALFTNDTYKFYVAKHRKNIKVYYGQHGGNFGIDKYHMHEVVERKLSDIFFTYGWKGKNTNFLPNQRTTRRVFGGKKILLIMTAPSRYFVMFQYLSTSSRAPGSLKGTINFMREIQCQENIIVRDHPGMKTNGWNEKEIILNSLPLIQFDSEKNYYDQIAKSKIVVFNHLHTGYLETLSENIPTVIFIQWADYEFREDAKHLINQLLDVNILFKSHKDAAEHINTIYHNVDQWWMSKDVQTARIQFCNQYFITSKHWAKDWCRAILANTN